MADANALRQALAAFLGEDQYRKFIKQAAVRSDRLAHWQEREWGRFVAAYPEFAVEAAERTAALRVCHLHGDELRPDTVEVLHGCRDFTQEYVDVRNLLFPHAAIDSVSTEGRPIHTDRVEVRFCPSCREAAVRWRQRRA